MHESTIACVGPIPSSHRVYDLLWLIVDSALLTAEGGETAQ